MKKLFILFFFLVFIFRIQISFLNYINFINKPIKHLNVKVINQYKKKNYYVLKLKNNEVSFYTTSRDYLKDLLNENLSLNILTKNISFLGFLTKFYAISYDLKLKNISFLNKWIEKQHKDKKFANLYKALFLGEAISHKTRLELSTLGISHLFALSGFHLGFISFILFLIFSPIYNLFHRKFPYRNKFFDLGILVFALEFLYLYITSFPPSLIRAFVMEIILFLFAYNLQNIFSLKILFLTIIFSFLIFFAKIFSIGFFLSISGVFYIMLFFRYFKPDLKNTILMNFFVFMMMFVFSHIFFGNINIYQFLSPFATLLFIVFYPLAFVLHLLGIGGISDNILGVYLHLGDNFYVYKISLWIGILFFGLSLVAFYKRWAFYGINILAFSLILGGMFV